MHAKSRVMRQNWRYINMVTKNQLKVDKITENLSVCDSSETNLKNFCGKRHEANAQKMKVMENYAATTWLALSKINVKKTK